VDTYQYYAAQAGSRIPRYAARVPPQLFTHLAAWSDSHVWVMPRQERRDERRERAVLAFLKYLYDHNVAWAKTGHVPSRQSVLAGQAFASMPGRGDYRGLAWIARGLPPIEAGRAVQDVLTQHVNAVWLAGQAPEMALRQAQDEVERLLARTRSRRSGASAH